MDEKSIPSPTVSMALDANNIIQLPPIYATEVPTISDVEKGSESIGVTYKSDDKDDATGETLEPEPISERPIHPPREDFTVFNSGQKKMIVFTASLASIFSPMATSIYYPSLDTISRDLNVSNSQVNLTITLFLVIQGIAPSFVADLADKLGRRPMYIICFIIFNAANIGLAIQNNYTTLLVLRMLQAAGSSGTVALANGVVGDIITSAERGQYIGFTSMAFIFGTMVAPLIGGAIGEFAGWHFLFWFLFISSCVVNIPLILFLPETCRTVVDDGSIPPPLFSINFTDKIRHKHRQKAGLKYDKEKKGEIQSAYRFRFPNPLSTLTVLRDLESAIILMSTGLGLGCFYAISTGSSMLFHKLYGFNQLQVSLMFIPIGCGSIVAAVTIGKLVDWNYRRHAAKLGLPITKNRVQDLANFPIEKARVEIVLPACAMAGLFTIAYAWIMMQKLPLVAPVIALFLLSLGLTASSQVMNILIVDIYPGKPSTATAASNIVRCELGAVLTAIILPLIEAIETGWAYTLLASLVLGFTPVLILLMKKGPEWRRVRKIRDEKSAAARLERSNVGTPMTASTTSIN